jgi:rhodanese-related sulfurtransferase
MQAITREKLESMRASNQDFVLVNVLAPQAFNEQHIQASINIPLGQENFTKQVESVAGSKDRDVVVYCASFDCNASPKAAKKLEEAGFRNVYDYEGGTADWMKAH